MIQDVLRLPNLIWKIKNKGHLMKKSGGITLGAVLAVIFAIKKSYKRENCEKSAW